MKYKSILSHQINNQEQIELDNIRDVRLSKQIDFAQERVAELKQLKFILKRHRLKDKRQTKKFSTKNKILLFDNDPEHLETISNLLSDWGYPVDIILDWDDFEGREDIIYKIAFIYTGYTRWNAIGCLDESPHAAKTKIYVILPKERDEAEIREHYLEEGADGILSFPFKNEELREILKDA